MDHKNPVGLAKTVTGTFTGTVGALQSWIRVLRMLGGCGRPAGCSTCWVSSPLTQAWTCPYHSPQLLQSSVNAFSLLPMKYPWAQTYSSSSPISKPVWPCRMVWGKDGGSPQGLSERKKEMTL